MINPRVDGDQLSGELAEVNSHVKDVQNIGLDNKMHEKMTV